jgi:hypothetical protein
MWYTGTLQGQRLNCVPPFNPINRPPFSHHTELEEVFALPKGVLVIKTFAYINKNTRAEGQDTILPLPSNA